MFPTTVWTVIRHAGEQDERARDEVATRYRRPVLEFLGKKGFAPDDAEDLCQDVFLRLFRGDALEKADRAKGRFRSYLLTIASRVAIDRMRKRADAVLEHPPEVVERDPEFDGPFALALLGRALETLYRDAPDAYATIDAHLKGAGVDRNDLWVARKKLVQKIRHEIALTCDSREQIEDEVAYLERYLRPAQKL
jgi:RNA polymerase sigma factor (sigma-70 family)